MTKEYLEALERLVCCDEDIGYTSKYVERDFNIVKQALLKAQEQEKVLKIIKGKVIWIENDKLMCGRYADTEIELEEEDFENKEEFNTLRGMLDD